MQSEALSTVPFMVCILQPKWSFGFAANQREGPDLIFSARQLRAEQVHWQRNVELLISTTPLD